jgi:hypothetical protein
MYTNQTGPFPTKSSCGHQYIMVLIEIDSNAILVKAMKNRTTGEMIQAYQVLVDCLCSMGVTPKMHILDNKCSAEFKERIQLNNMQYTSSSLHMTTGTILLRKQSRCSRLTS